MISISNRTGRKVSGLNSPCDPQSTSDHSVRNFSHPGIVAQPQSKAAVNYAESNKNSAPYGDNGISITLSDRSHQVTIQTSRVENNLCSKRVGHKREQMLTPDMSSRPDRPQMVLFEKEMVNPAEDWLEGEKANNHKADDGMVGINLIASVLGAKE